MQWGRILYRSIRREALTISIDCRPPSTHTPTKQTPTQGEKNCVFEFLCAAFKWEFTQILNFEVCNRSSKAQEMGGKLVRSRWFLSVIVVLALSGLCLPVSAQSRSPKNVQVALRAKWSGTPLLLEAGYSLSVSLYCKCIYVMV